MKKAKHISYFFLSIPINIHACHLIAGNTKRQPSTHKPSLWQALGSCEEPVRIKK